MQRNLAVVAPATRDRILDAALRAFASRGVDGTPITDLEEAAGLAPGSGGFYRYFRTKDEVLAAVVRREIDRVEAAERERGPVPADGDVRSMLAEGFAIVRSLRSLMAILAREHGRIPDLAAEVADRLVAGGMRADAGRFDHLTASSIDPRSRWAITTSAIVGYSLATDYFGEPPGGVAPEDFLDALAALLAGPPTG